MSDDQTFRLILMLGMVAVLPVGLYHRLRSQASREKLDRRQEGLFILLTLRPIGLAGMGGLLTFVASPARMAWSSVPLPVWLRWAGVAIGIVGGALLIWTFRSLGTNITDTVVTRRQHTLVTTGPYRFVRHPFYVASALAFTANALAIANWFLALMGGLAMALLVLRTPIEEAHLVLRFGDAYAHYMQRTGRFFPRMRST
jgi:protein-S-isoprenylcysteine O-methyltransferase Ste14